MSEVIKLYEDFIDKRVESLTLPETEDCSKRSVSLSLKKDTFNKKWIVGLKISAEGFNLPTDSYLSQFDLPLSRLPDSLELNIHYSSLNGSNSEYMDRLKEGKYQISINNFELLNFIGRGGYSKVVSARKKDSGRLYAIKMMDKHLIDTNYIRKSIVVNEKNVHGMFKNDPFFVNLYWAFEDINHYYFVTELWVGGSLYNLLTTHEALDELTILNYSSQILIMLRKMHLKKVIYRDLKPENILIDVYGNLKLADFGLAKVVPELDSLNDTFWGSPEYMAPEMLLEESHDSTIDFYTLGWLLHEMVSSFPPNYSKNRDKMNDMVMHDGAKLEFNSSKELKHLIRWWLNKNIDLRPQTVEIIMDHPFFYSVKWKDVQERNISAPWIPSLMNHFNPKLTKILITDNVILSCDSPVNKHDSRTSVYFDKKQNNRTSIVNIIKYFFISRFLLFGFEYLLKYFLEN